MTDLSTVDDAMASYLDIDSILMEEQKIVCQAKQNMNDLDFRRQKEGKSREAGFYSNFESHFQIFKRARKSSYQFGWPNS